MEEFKMRVVRIKNYTKMNYLLFVMKSSANCRDVIQLRECIDMLREFAIDLPYVQPRPSIQDQIPAKLDNLNNQANVLHRCIKRLWGCECKKDHELYVVVFSGVDDESLRLMFASDSAHKEPAVENRQWTSQWPLLAKGKLEVEEGEIQHSESLCEGLASFASDKPEKRQHTSSLDVDEQLQMYTDVDRPSHASLITLKQELDRREGEIRMYASSYLRVTDCVTLGILFLTGILRYHWTPWLPDSWTSDDIYFLRRGESLSRSDLRSPLLRSGFQDNPSTAIHLTSTEMFFEVGIILLEMVHGKSFSCLMTEPERTGAAQDDPEDRLMWRTRAAGRLFRDIPAYMCLRSYKEASKPTNQVIAIIRNVKTAAQLYELAKSHPNVHIVIAEVTNDASMTEAAAKISEITGGNIGQGEEMKSDLLDAVRNIVIICISSGLALEHVILGMNMQFAFGYSVARAGLGAIVSKLAIQLKGEGIICVSLSPGWVKTAINEMDGATFQMMLAAVQQMAPDVTRMLSVEESVAYQLATIDKLTLEQSGKLISHVGDDKTWF
ncbi:hypothetical protein IFR05_001411 [Cadophora sp. M221]|nr:hypothetical protein IFR05_001411 [Cadophora sp. M221]